MIGFATIKFLGQYTRLPPRLRAAIVDLDSWLVQKSWPHVVITCINRTAVQNASVGGVSNSLHTDVPSRAVDIRDRDYTPEQVDAIKAFLAKRCPRDQFEVLFEGANDPHSTGTHIHLGLKRGVPDDA